MKFYWKVFFTVMFICTVCLSSCGYVLIHANFRALLNSEEQIAADYADIVYYTLDSELFRRSNAYTADDIIYYGASGQPVYELTTQATDLLQVAQSLSIRNGSDQVPFALLDAKGEELCSSLPQQLPRDTRAADPQLALGRVRYAEGRFFVQVLRPATYLGQLYYIEIQREVSHVFTAWQLQYQILLKTMCTVLAAAALITLLISRLLLRRIGLLSAATEGLAAGDLQQRCPVGGRDEIGQLAQNFNQMADKLQLQMLHLQEEAESRERFVAAFSHELKTPLTSIIGYADLLRRSDLPAEQRQLAADYIFSEGQRLDSLSMRLLELMVLKQQQLRFTPTDVTRLLAQLQQQTEQRLQQAGIRFSCAAEPALIPMEAELMQTVLLNLLDNAIKATPA
ncbi:MAG: HAMP domain-containing protein, partial [Firmicutes bacterium]|nr:HAMP domain-containing protein [Bacillota bacterium]